VGAAAVALLATVLARRSPRWAARGTALIALVAVGDLALPNRRVNPMVPSGLLGRPPETAQRLHADGATRVHAIENEPRAGQGLPRRSDLDPAFPLPPPEALALGLNLALSGRSSSRWGLAGSFTMDALVAPTREQLELSGLFNAVADQPVAVRLLQAGAVSHVVARSVLPEGLEPLAEVPSPLAAPIRLFRVPSPLPRSYVVGAVTTGSDEEALRFVLHSGEERRRTAVLADGQALQGAAAFSGTARVVRFAPDEVEVEVDAPSVACLVLVEAYDPGWSASVDGQPTRVHRANYGFRAVRVPAGRHSVRLRYWPRGLTPGLVVSGLALVGSLVALGFEKRLAAG
jgi:hypothetical protein